MLRYYVRKRGEVIDASIISERTELGTALSENTDKLGRLVCCHGIEFVSTPYLILLRRCNFIAGDDGEGNSVEESVGGVRLGHCVLNPDMSLPNLSFPRGSACQGFCATVIEYNSVCGKVVDVTGEADVGSVDVNANKESATLLC